MISEDTRNIVRLHATQTALRKHFLGWQCRVRALAVRQAGGRPSGGMRPRVSVADSDEVLEPITVLIVRHQSHETTAQFRHLVRRTHDPAERTANALQSLSANHYQHPEEFSDEMTGLFGPGSELARRLVHAGRCVLHFEEYRQRYRIPCSVRQLPARDPAYQATYWHNSLFNPVIPPDAEILAFRPDWAASSASA